MIHQYFRRIIIISTILIIASLACSIPSNEEPTIPTERSVRTQPPATRTPSTPQINDTTITETQTGPTTPVLETTQAPPIPTVEVPPIIPPTLTPSLTATPIPCNWAQYIGDLTVPDDTPFLAGTTFTKTWRLKNIGSCPWTSGYQVIFVQGDQMGAPPATKLTNGVINPGDIVDASVTLVAPNTDGTFQGSFRLRSADSIEFGIGASADKTFWVKIVSYSPTPTNVPPAPPPVETKPDLIVTEFTLNPPTPTQGQPVHVRIGAYNNGTAKSGAFTVKWYGLKTFAGPSCTWNIDSMNAKGGRILECNFTFNSWYASGTTRVIVDTENTIGESEEGNNIADYPIKVNKP